MNKKTLLKHLLPALLCTAALFGQTLASAVPKCGDTINLNSGTVTLTASLGPCPANGLLVRGPGTLNLNGQTIRGVAGSTPSSGAGLWVDSGVTINGPGTITNFSAGVAIGPTAPFGTTSTGIIVQNLTLRNNTTGVSMNFATDIHIRGNKFLPGTIGNNAQTGIFATSSGSLKIKENSITGQSTIGVLINNSIDVAVIQNVIRQNADGLVATAATAGLGLSLIGNDLTENCFDGARITSGDNLTLVTVVGNDASYNTNDAFSLNGGPSAHYRAEDNQATLAGRYGIAVNYGGWSILDNLLSRSGTYDIFWDGVGTANTCFALNQVDSSSPATLPPRP